MSYTLPTVVQFSKEGNQTQKSEAHSYLILATDLKEENLMKEFENSDKKLSDEDKIIVFLAPEFSLFCPTELICL